jgi:hypothetical protein
MPDGTTRSARPSIAYAYPTLRGGARTITALPMVCAANPRLQTAQVMRSRYHRAPLLAQDLQAACNRKPTFPSVARLILSRQARYARGG